MVENENMAIITIVIIGLIFYMRYMSNNDNNLTFQQAGNNNEWEKSYRVFVDANGGNKLKVNAKTFGNKTAFSEALYYIDKTAPSLNLALYKTASESVPNTIPTISSTSNNDFVNNNTWINSLGKQNAYLIVESSDSNSGVDISGIDEEKSYCNVINNGY